MDDNTIYLDEISLISLFNCYSKLNNYYILLEFSMTLKIEKKFVHLKHHVKNKLRNCAKEVLSLSKYSLKWTDRVV